MKMGKRLNLFLPEPDYIHLVNLAEVKGVSVPVLARRAIEEFISKAKKSGHISPSVPGTNSLG